jgi:hypothetical protein
MKPSKEMAVHLHRETTLAEYEREFGLEWLKGSQDANWATLRAEVESVLAQGGELWEWEYRGELGLTGITGLAVVREGTVVRKWQLWKA